MCSNDPRRANAQTDTSVPRKERPAKTNVDNVKCLQAYTFNTSVCKITYFLFSSVSRRSMKHLVLINNVFAPFLRLWEWKNEWENDSWPPLILCGILFIMSRKCHQEYCQRQFPFYPPVKIRACTNGWLAVMYGSSRISFVSFSHCATYCKQDDARKRRRMRKFATRILPATASLFFGDIK